MLTFRKLLLYSCITILFCNLLSCSIENRLTSKTIQKKIKAKSENEKGEVCIENDFVIIYLERRATLKTFENEKKNKSISSCNRERLTNYIAQINRSSNSLVIFQELSNPTNNANDFEIYLQRHLIEILLLHNDFAVFNKKAGLYENSIIYKKQGGDWGCCNAGFAFKNGDYFLRTKIWSDLIMIEDCNE